MGICYSCSKRAPLQAGFVSSLSLPAAFLKKAPSPQPTEILHRLGGMRSGLGNRWQETRKKFIPLITLTHDMTDGSLIKNNSPVITPYVPRRQLANFQGLEDFIKGCVLGIIKNLGILLAGYNKTGNICFGFNTVIDTLERIRVHPNVVYISFAEVQMPCSGGSCPKN